MGGMLLIIGALTPLAVLGSRAQCFPRQFFGSMPRAIHQSRRAYLGEFRLLSDRGHFAWL
jgi:hypothetical protein